MDLGGPARPCHTGLGNEECVCRDGFKSCEIGQKISDDVVDAVGEGAVPVPPVTSILEIAVLEVVHNIGP